MLDSPQHQSSHQGTNTEVVPTGTPSLGTRRYTEALLQYKEEQGWNDQQVAEWAGVSKAYVGKLRRQEVDSVGISVIETMVRKLRVHPEFFFDPSRVKLDYHDYLPERRRTLFERLAVLEQSLGRLGTRAP